MWDGSFAFAMHDVFFLFCNINANKIKKTKPYCKAFQVCSLFQSGGYRPGWCRWGRPNGGACEPADGPVLGHLPRVQQIDLWPVFWHLTTSSRTFVKCSTDRFVTSSLARVRQRNWFSMCHQDVSCTFNSRNKCRQQSMTFSGMNEGWKWK